MASLPGVAGAVYYPFAKRHTHLAQAVLGFCLAWSIVVGSRAVGAERPWADASTLALVAAAILWVVLFDTVYAHQDLVDDIRVGVKSTAVLLRTGAGAAGPASRPRLFLWLLLLGMLAALALSGCWAGMGAAYHLLAVGGCAASVGRMVAAVDLDDPASCWLWFSQGFWMPGLAIAAGLGAEYASRNGGAGVILL
ncbi:hypothetical protein CDD83_8637 [Cordyceps sp. RAO-2017]|nr:hypothetical protein CDD83_8637 [Cordyceps sp. RAO-2017]